MIPANDIKKNDKLYKISNPEIVQKNANKYYNNIIVYKSDKPNKKYFVIHNNNKYILEHQITKIIHFIKLIKDY